MTSVLPVVLTMLILMLVRHPGGAAMSCRIFVDAPWEVDAHPRQPWLVSEAELHPPEYRTPFRTTRWRPVEPEEVDLVDALVTKAKAGDVDAFGALFDHFHSPVFRQLLAQTRSQALAEDLTSETFFKAMRAVSGFALPSRLFGPWLRRIARNLAADHYKASRTRLELVTADLSFHDGLVASPEDLLIESLDHAALQGALLRLPENQRRAVALRFFGQLSISETAAELGCTEGAAKQLQWRGLRNLARLLGGEVRGS